MNTPEIRFPEIIKRAPATLALLAVAYLGYGGMMPMYVGSSCPETDTETVSWTGADGHYYEETHCVDANTRERVVGDCCCFVASASGLSPDQINSLRSVRDVMNDTVPGFKTYVSDTYPTWGPKVASVLRAEPTVKRLVHSALAPAASAIDRAQEFRFQSENSQMRQEQLDARLR